MAVRRAIPSCRGDAIAKSQAHELVIGRMERDFVDAAALGIVIFEGRDMAIG